MSNLEGEVDFQAIKDSVNTPERRASESSRDSSKSSSTSGQSDDESGSTTGSTETEHDKDDDNSGEQSDGADNVSAATDQSTESYKSMNASVLKADSSIGAKSEKTPVVAGVNATVKAVKNQTPAKAEVKTPKPPSVNTEKGSRGKSQSMSPVQVTPAKSLVIGESPRGEQSDVEFRSPSGRGMGTSKHRAAPEKVDQKAEMCSSDVVESIAIEPQVSDKPGGSDQSTAERKRSRHPEKVVKKELQSPKKKRVKKVKERVDRVKEQSKSVERMEKQVKQLQAQLNEVVSADRGHNKKGKNRKSSKTKKSKNQSSGECSSRTSSSEEPTSSTRIGKISTGRKNQRIAMSRTKQLGVIRQGEIHVLEVSEALKIIDKSVFVVSPTHGYKLFNRLPGVELPHIQIHVKELMERMGSFVKLTAKLCLEVTHEQDMAKKERIGPEADNKYAVLWQFANDLSRATAADQHLETTLATHSEGLGVSKAASIATKAAEVDSKEVVTYEAASSSDRHKGATASKQKVAKKKKSAGSKAEDRPE